MSKTVRLKALLREKHWQTYRTFCRQYDTAAREIDPQLVGTWPSRAQLHRWQSGDLKGLPYPDHCRILETMFPEWTAAQLFEPVVDSAQSPERFEAASTVINEVAARLEPDVEAPGIDWQALTPSGPWAGSTSTSLSAGTAEAGATTAQTLGRELVTLAKVRRYSEEETRQIASLVGELVELRFDITIDIRADGWSTVVYESEILNLTDTSLTRVAREIWFETTESPMKIKPLQHTGYRSTIQRLHDTPNMASFATQITPAVQPGKAATVAFSCEGGRFVYDHYWRQRFGRYVRQFTLTVRQPGEMVSCTAVEEHPDGSENSIGDALLWDEQDGSVVMTLTRDFLRPNQAVTLRWEVDRDDA